MFSQQLRSRMRASFWRLLSALVLCLALGVPLAGQAQAGTRHGHVPRAYAGIVVDAKTGKVLYSQDADQLRYPASISKVMTLYILFQELNAGRLSLGTMMPVSRHAAAAEPSKLGLKPGSKISVENAIKSIVTISANDMARVIAEEIGGTETKFAKRMTATARALGMDHTTYVNASGLPDRRQVTTVRDQARLGIAVYEHFPKFVKYFSLAAFRYNGRTYGNHDRLLGHKGVNGMKTGYTRASGFNLLTASEQGDKHLVVAAFGFATSRSRDNKVRALVDKYLPKARSGSYLRTAMIPPIEGTSRSQVMVASIQQPVVPAPLPDFRQADTNTPAAEVVAYAPEPAAMPPAIKLASISAETGIATAQPMNIGVRPAVQAANQLGAGTRIHKSLAKPDIVGQWINDTVLGAPPAPLGATRPSTPLVPPVGVGTNGQPIDLMTSGAIGKSSAKAPAIPTDGWIVQIGATPDVNGANRLLSTATAKIGALADLRPYVEQFNKNGQTYYRARFVGFGGRLDASNMCAELKKADMSCLAMQG